jgi:uncharacterized protein YijF (DUF1287 family)
MSFTDFPSTPHHAKSPDAVIKHARKRYLAKYMTKTDKQLDSDY